MVETDLRTRLQEIAEELRAMASNGLHFGHDEYDIARYQRIMRLAAEIMSITDTRSLEEIAAIYSGHIDIYTPMVGVDAAIFDGQGRILLIQRADNGRWAMPGGAADVGESPADGAVREAEEETGLRVRPIRLLGVYDSRKSGGTSPRHIYHITFACEVVGGELSITNETIAYGYFAEHDLPPLFSSHNFRVPDAFRRQRDGGTTFQ